MTQWPVAYQLYSSRLFPPLDAQLPLLRAMGYDAIEPWLPAYDSDPAAFARALRDNGLACMGFHMPLSGLMNETDRFVEIAQTLGARVMIPPWIAPEERGTTADDWRRLGDSLAEGAERVRPHGLRVAWHNHDFEYVPLPDGTRPIDHILAAPGVDYEIDIGWLTRAGADPGAELRRHADRIVAIQMKDMAPRGTLVEDGWAATGDGIIDWQALVPLFAQTRADHLVTEHDNPVDWQRTASRSIQFMRRIGL